MLKDLMKTTGFQAGKFVTSPYFSREIAIGGLAANGRIDFDFTKGAEASVLPLNEAIITNASGQMIRLHLDTFTKIVPPNGFFNLPTTFRRASIFNLTNIPNSGIIELAYRRKVYIEDIILEFLK